MVTSTSTLQFPTKESPAEQIYTAALAFEDMLGELPSHTISNVILSAALDDLENAILGVQAAALLALARDGQLVIKDCA
jgi:hypothetical protein